MEQATSLIKNNIKKYKKMDISQTLRKILFEQGASKKTQGVDFNDTSVLLSNAIAYCKGIDFLKNRSIKAMTKTSPIDTTNNTPLMLKFPDVYKSGKENVAFASGDAGGSSIVVFGMQDPNLTENALLGYRVSANSIPDRIVGGIAKGCQYIQAIEDVGQTQLSAYDKSRLDSFIRKQGGLFTTTDPQDSLNYREYKMSDLKDEDGKPLLQSPGQGIVWKKVSAGTQEMGNKADEMYNYMTNNGFTLKSPPIGTIGAELGFYLSTVKDDLRAMKMDVDLRSNQIYYPDENFTTQYGEKFFEPSKKTCRNVIRKLFSCKNKQKSEIPDAGCIENLLQNKIIAIACKKKNLLDGVLGQGDELNDLAGDAVTSYGLKKLTQGITNQGTKYASITESLHKKINKRLNEDFNKLSYNKKKIKFDQKLIESLTDQVVVGALFDLNRDFNKLQKIQENVATDLFNRAGEGLSNIGSGISNFLSGGKWSDIMGQSVKESIIKYILRTLGFDTKSFMGLFVANIFANVDIKEWPDFFDNCPNYTAEITKAALEAWLEQALQKMGTDQYGMTSFIYSVLKNAVTEAAANTEPFRRLQDLAGTVACTIISKLNPSDILTKFI